MSNMSYCRFQNTASDLDDCQGALESLFNSGFEEDGDLPLSRDEVEAAKRLVIACQNILEMVADYQGKPVEDLTEPDLCSAIDDANQLAKESLELDRKAREKEANR